MEGLLFYDGDKAMAEFNEGEMTYRAAQVCTFGMADHPHPLYLDEDASVKKYVEEHTGKGCKLKKENYVPDIPHGTLVYVIDYLDSVQFAVVRLCKLTKGNIIVVTKKWGFLWWNYDDSYGLMTEDDTTELRNFLNLEDEEIRNVLRVDERKSVCGKDLYYYVQFETTGDDAGVVGPTGPKPEDFIKTTENPKYKEVKLDGVWVKEHYEAIRKGEVLLVEGAVLHDILNEAGKNFYNFLGNALGLYSIRLIEKKGATDGVSELYTGTLMNLQENITRTFVKLYDKIEEKAYKTEFEEDSNG